MSFRQRSSHGMGQGNLYIRGDIANVLNSLEITNPRSGYELGWMEALRRVGLAVGLEYEPDSSQQQTWALEEPQRSSVRLVGRGAEAWR